MLAPTDYEITEAENGEKALAAIASGAKSSGLGMTLDFYRRHLPSAAAKPSQAGAMFAIRRASSAREEFQQPQQIKDAENDKGIEGETNNHYRERPRNHRHAKLLIIFRAHPKPCQHYIDDGGNRQERDSYNEIR
jgi:hypothetical protein